MAVKPVIYRISYSVYDEVLRPLPQFYFYIEACNEQQALEKLNIYAESEGINYRSVAVGYTLAAEDLPQELGAHQLELDRPESLAKGIAIKRDDFPSNVCPTVAA